MKKAACPRLWQVQALRDGSLSGQLEADASGHVQSCSDCRQEAGALTELQRELQANPPHDELALRRLRHATLAKASSQLHGAAQPRRRVWLKLTVALAGLAAVVALVFWWQRPTAGTLVDLQASAGAVWTRHSVPGIEYVDLAEGMLTITVHRKPSDPRLIVRVPDGDIEDTGTRFRVWVGDARTRQISVETGSIIFRRLQAAPILLQAGGLWQLAEPTAPRPIAAPEPDVAQPPSQHARARLQPEAPKAAAPRLATAPHAAAPADSGATDEDLAYLHIVALLHEARDEEARLAAQQYLRRYPDGFRRVEVAKIVTAATPSTTDGGR